MAAALCYLFHAWWRSSCYCYMQLDILFFLKLAGYPLGILLVVGRAGCWRLLACLADVRPVAFVLDFGCSFGAQWSSIALCSWLLDFMLAFANLVVAKCRRACVAAFLAAGFRIAGANE
ncbi:hypothetical protein NC653_031953 [Populus alba x Populus x berolinensis]|uniref:Uncharacterized protein n=1 Tax=Populus alba x Populus x berolinensis TaxID=444605 RepID=A0AAD6Q267_9ROSI|nr:hypothetical protein NC653_031953 [Populus alba x Populus x berolinensis]